MASSSSPASLYFSLPLLILLLFHPTISSPLILTIVNNCPYTIYPALQPNSGHQLLAGGGFPLPTLTHRSFSAPETPWSGRIWARTDCFHHPKTNIFTCASGDCGGRVECAGAGASGPVTLAQFSLHHGGHADLSSYGISLVDGFNLPATVTPHEGKGKCPVVGCMADLRLSCPRGLQHRDGEGKVVGCKSGCEALKTDELCCRNGFERVGMCRRSIYSDFFKHSCPATFTFAHDTPSVEHECSSPRELKVIFCH